MAITTLAGVQAGLTKPQFFQKGQGPLSVAAGGFASHWYIAGAPAAGVADISTPNGVVRSSSSGLVQGQIPFFDPPAGKKTYLAKFQGTGRNSVAFGMVMLCDRLWDCGAQSSGVQISPSTITAQTINSAVWPARDALGGTNGVGVIIGLEVAASLGATPPSTATISYTNTTGAAGNTGTISNIAGSLTQGTFCPFYLAAGDLGVKSVQSLTLGTSVTSGTIILVAYRVLSVLSFGTLNYDDASDPLMNNFPQLYNGTVPMLLSEYSSGNAAQFVGGQLVYAQG